MLYLKFFECNPIQAGVCLLKIPESMTELWMLGQLKVIQ